MNKKFFVKAAPAVLAVSMFAGSASAAPIDELNEIMEKTASQQSESMIHQALGLSDLCKAIEENGVEFSQSWTLPSETAEMLGISELIPEGLGLKYGFKQDPKKKAWGIDAGIISAEGSIVDLNLSGDTNHLVLSVPQILSKALSIDAGSIKSQFDGSMLAEIMGASWDELGIPDFDLSFYPDLEANPEMLSVFNDVIAEIEAKSQAIEKNLQVEKVEVDETNTTYVATIQVADIMDIYRVAIDGFTQPAKMLGTVTTVDLDEFEQEVNTMLDQMGAILGEELTVNFDVEDGMLSDINTSLYLDTSSISELDGAEGSAFKALVSYDFRLNDPKDAAAGFVYTISIINDENEDESINMFFDVYRDQTETTESYLFTLDINANNESIYSGSPLYITFDSETNELYASLEITDENGETAGAYVTGTFDEIEKGKSFVFNLDSLSLEQGEMNIAVAGQTKVSAAPSDVTNGQEVQNVFGLDQAGLITMVTEAQANATSLAAEYMPWLFNGTEDAEN